MPLVISLFTGVAGLLLVFFYLFLLSGKILNPQRIYPRYGVKLLGFKHRKIPKDQFQLFHDKDIIIARPTTFQFFVLGYFLYALLNKNNKNANIYIGYDLFPFLMIPFLEWIIDGNTEALLYLIGIFLLLFVSVIHLRFLLSRKN